MSELRNFDAEDLTLEQRIQDLHLIPGKTVAVCSVLWVDAAADTTHSSLWLYPQDGSAPRRLTQGKSSDSHPRWSPDGRTIAFTSDRGGTPQIHLIPADGG